MAVTAIKFVLNQRADDIFVTNWENPADADLLRFRPLNKDQINMWIPWADNQDQFDNGSNPNQGPAHITIYDVNQSPLFSIFQSGNHVYYVIGEECPADPADRHFVGTDNGVGGDRELTVTDTDAGPQPSLIDL